LKGEKPMSKILVLDIDGTLTNSKKEITPKTKEAIAKAIEIGTVVVIASGRPTPGTRKVCEELELDKKGGYVLSYNGARITELKSGKTVYQKTLEKKFIPEIYEYVLEKGIGMLTYENDDAITGTDIDEYMELEARINNIALRRVEDFVSYVDFDVNKCLLTAKSDYAEKIEKELAERYDGLLSVYRSEPFFVEIMPKGVDKAATLSHLLEILDMKREDMIAVGDGFNDLSMIKFAGLGVAMENATDVVKEAADEITKSNDNDGVAEVINKFIMNIKKD
jgi:hypothetical protein